MTINVGGINVFIENIYKWKKAGYMLGDIFEKTIFYHQSSTCIYEFNHQCFVKQEQYEVINIHRGWIARISSWIPINFDIIITTA